MAHSLPEVEAARVSHAGSARRAPAGPGNDTDWIEARIPETLDRPAPVSIVIPVYNRKRLLARTLAALTHQTWPRDQIEVVIADDGSSDGVEDVLRSYATRLHLRHVRQEDRGYRLSAVRNLAIRAASHEPIVLLDCDVLPTPRLVESYMRGFAATDRAVFLGLRRFVDASGVTDADLLEDASLLDALPRVVCDNPKFDRFRDAGGTYDWRLDVYAATDRLKRDAHPYRCVVGATFAFTRSAFDEVGGFCEDFEHWGFEDGEFGYRLQTRGYWFLPIDAALGLHQEPEEPAQRSDRVGGVARTRDIAADRCPGVYRPRDDDRRYRVPTVTITLTGESSNADLARTLASLRAQTWTDWECLVSSTDSHAVDTSDERIRSLSDELARDPASEWSDSLAMIPRGATIARGALDSMLAALLEDPTRCAVVSPTRGSTDPAVVARRRDLSRLEALGHPVTTESPRRLVASLETVGTVHEFDPPESAPTTGTAR